jgi:hypothetical protein
MAHGAPRKQGVTKYLSQHRRSYSADTRRLYNRPRILSIALALWLAPPSYSDEAS